MHGEIIEQQQPAVGRYRRGSQQASSQEIIVVHGMVEISSLTSAWIEQRWYSSGSASRRLGAKHDKLTMGIAQVVELLEWRHGLPKSMREQRLYTIGHILSEAVCAVCMFSS